MYKMNLPMNLQFFAEEGENDSAVAELNNETDVSTSEGDAGVNEPEPAEPVQSAEENAKYAAARREAEEKAKMRQAETDKRFQDLFSGYRNPITGQAIDGVDSYLEAIEAQRQYELQQQLKQNGVDPELINQAIQNNPLIKQAENIISQQAEVERQKMIESELKEIYALDPTIKTPEDLINMDSTEQFKEYVSKGYTFVDAFKLANFSKLQQKNTDAVKQAAINQAKSTSHMDSISGVTEPQNDLAPIPDNVLSLWKQSYPELSLSELTAKYNAVL